MWQRDEGKPERTFMGLFDATQAYVNKAKLAARLPS